jgi:ATP-dependent Clp protease, protease subunit
VMGLAASAASIIAMAGDDIEMGLGSMMMIHNSWGVVVGNQDDMRDAAETFAEFDAAMADIYAARTGGDLDDIKAMMAGETWLRAERAIAEGFADSTFDIPEYEENGDDAARNARSRLDATLAKAGVPRVERRRLFGDAIGTPNAVKNKATPNAGFEPGDLRSLIQTLKV